MTDLPRTPRLHMRELEERDLDFVAGMLGDPLVMRYYPRRYTRDEAWSWIVRQQERYMRDGHALWLLTSRESGEPVGQAGLLIQVVDAEPHPEIGYLLHHHWWGRGLATEAATAIRDWAFSVRGVERVISLIRPENEPSRRVAERIGMTRWKGTVWAGMAHDVFTRVRDGGGGPGR